MGVLNKVATWAVDVLTPHAFREAAGKTIDADEEGWRALTGDTGRDLTPLGQSRMRESAIYLWDGNLLANRIIELPLAYLLGEGVSLRVPKEQADEQRVLDRFWRDPINEMDLKLPKKVRELSLFGEQCYPTFVNELDGHVRLGYLDPAEIATVVTDPDNREQVIGIVSTKDKHGNARRYKVIVNGPEGVFTQRTQAIRETFTGGECFFFTINDLSLSRRGRSDLRAQADWVDGYDRFLFGELERYNMLRAFMWDVTLTGAQQEEVNQRAKEIKPPRAGSVRVHNENEKWNAVSPDLQAGDTSEGARMFRNHALGGATTPEHWFGGGGDVNRATGESMSEPTFKVYSMRQRQIKHFLESMGRYCIRQNILATEGTEPEWDDPRLSVEAVFAEMTSRDTTKYAAALQQVVTACSMAVDKGLLTAEAAVRLIAAVAAQLGVEVDAADELQKAKDAKAKQNEDDTFTGVEDTPPAGNKQAA